MNLPSGPNLPKHKSNSSGAKRKSFRQSSSSLLEAERARSSAREATHSGLDEKDIAAEVSRVESLIKEIVALIDNPETELSTIIRKNVQKAELDAYLKGILFVLNRGKEA